MIVFSVSKNFSSSVLVFDFIHILIFSERQRPERLVRRSLGLNGDDQALK
jgi:hypothetical protein